MSFHLNSQPSSQEKFTSIGYQLIPRIVINRNSHDQLQHSMYRSRSAMDSLPWPLVWIPFLVGVFCLCKMAGFVASELQFAFHRSQLHRFRHTGGQASSKNSEGKAWALVTGASDGVGKACVDKLAGQGFSKCTNVVDGLFNLMPP